MFTGLVEHLSRVESMQPDGAGGARLRVQEPALAPHLILGESVAVNGACLTVVDRDESGFSFQLGPETLARTNLGKLQPGDRVNLERALRMGDRLGGHLVQGHVDAVGTMFERRRQGEWEYVRFRAPAALLGQMVPQGSITVDGVSLTIVDVLPDGFSVMLIPHTLAVTTLGQRQPGDAVNLETDLLAKYVGRAIQHLQRPTPG